MNEPEKIINFCCARAVFLWMLFCLNIFCACCRSAPSPSLPGRGPGAAALNHGGVITVWARSPTTCRLLIASRLRGAGVPGGTRLGGLWGGHVSGVAALRGVGVLLKSVQGTSPVGAGSAGARSRTCRGAATPGLLIPSQQACTSSEVCNLWFSFARLNVANFNE